MDSAEMVFACRTMLSEEADALLPSQPWLSHGVTFLGLGPREDTVTVPTGPSTVVVEPVTVTVGQRTPGDPADPDRAGVAAMAFLSSSAEESPVKPPFSVPRRRAG